MAVPSEINRLLDDVGRAATAFVRGNDVIEGLEEFSSAVRAYFGESYLLSQELSDEIGRESSDSGAFSLGAPRTRLFASAVDDTLVLRCIGIVDCWAAASDPRYERDTDQLRQYLIEELDDVKSATDDNPLRVRGGQIPLDELDDVVRESIVAISEESTDVIWSASLGAFGAFFPGKLPNVSVRALVNIGRVAGLNKLLDWAKRMLDLALDKLQRIFGTKSNSVLGRVKDLFDWTSEIRNELAERIFRTQRLQELCDGRIRSIGISSASNDELDVYEDGVRKLVEAFEKWNRGCNIADKGLKWGWRISSINPAISVALTSLRGALAGGAFLIGQYHLDSPRLAFLPWQSHGVFSVFAESMESPR